MYIFVCVFWALYFCGGTANSAKSASTVFLTLTLALPLCGARTNSAWCSSGNRGTNGSEVYLNEAAQSEFKWKTYFRLDSTSKHHSCCLLYETLLLQVIKSLQPSEGSTTHVDKSPTSDEETVTLHLTVN